MTTKPRNTRASNRADLSLATHGSAPSFIRMIRRPARDNRAKLRNRSTPVQFRTTGAHA